MSEISKKKQKELLEILRVDIAKGLNIAPYSVFKDEELDRLLENQPKSLSELEGLKGFPKGGARVTKWGTAIVAIFKDTEKVKEFKIIPNGDGTVCAEAMLQRMECF